MHQYRRKLAYNLSHTLNSLLIELSQAKFVLLTSYCYASIFMRETASLLLIFSLDQCPYLHCIYHKFTLLTRHGLNHHEYYFLHQEFKMMTTFL